jgi:hypothetical protein
VVPGAPLDRSAALLDALGAGPATTSDLYDRVGYLVLVRYGLIQYAAFRGALVELEAQGLVTSETAPDGSTLWTRTGEDAPPS